VDHVDLADAAVAARGVDQVAQLLAAGAGLRHVADHQRGVAGGLVGRGDADRADVRHLVDDREVDADVLDPVELDLVDRLLEDALVEDQPVLGDFIGDAEILEPLQHQHHHSDREQ
jgi:hypothetical protein